jgi:uncharacterized protein (DUF2249 family)
VSIAAELIDVRTVPPLQRHPLIFGAFDALADGEGFELLNDHDPVPLYMQFERTRAGQFVWRYLESGPARWRVRIERRAAGAAGASASGCCGSCGGG